MTTQTSIFDAIRTGDSDALRRVLADDPAAAAARDEQGRTPVLLARYFGRTDALTALLASRTDLDIFEAAAVGDTDRVRALLDAEPGLVNAHAPDGFFPLGLAVFFNHPRTVRLLLERGADVHQAARNAMRVQSLHAALADKALEDDALALATLLIDAGADVNARQHGGYTPLLEAAQNGHARVVELLLARGADPAARTDDGKSATDLAAAHGHAEIAARLGAAG